MYLSFRSPKLHVSNSDGNHVHGPGSLVLVCSNLSRLASGTEHTPRLRLLHHRRGSEYFSFFISVQVSCGFRDLNFIG